MICEIQQREILNHQNFSKKRVNKKDRNKKRSFSGFTLVELLAVIVILSLTALITTPIVMNQIEQARKNGFINSAKNVLDAADIYVSNDNLLDIDGTNVQVLEIKNKEKVTGLVFQNSEAEYILKKFTDGNYCASGPRNDLVVRKGDCTNEEDLYASLSLSVKEKTTRKITVSATASDDTGISGYSYCVADCSNEANWKNSKNAEYTFDSLRYSKKYEIHVRVINRIDKVTEKTIEVVTDALPTASYKVGESGWTKQKTVTITYPNKVENYVMIHSGMAFIDDEVIPVGERKKISGTSVQVIFKTNGTIEAITSDGYNEASPSTLTISQVDPTSPESVSVGIGTVTSKSIQVIANGYDQESGIAKYEFQVNSGEWTDNGTSNTITYNNLKSGSYSYKVRLTNKAGGVTKSESRTQATTTIVAPSYSVTPSGWATSKTTTITYQSGYTNQYRVLSGSASQNGTPITNNTWITISGSSTSIVFNSNGSVEARSTDGINTVTSSALTTSQIDTTLPVVNSLSIASTNGSYNALTTTITSNVTDNSGTIQMYISNSGYETGGTWENYATSKAWNVGGSLNGGTRTVYITYKDQAGNKVNRTLSYSVYYECGSGNTTTTYGSYGACSKTCGGGTQSRSITTKDNKTGRTCSTTTGTQACNTQSCDPNMTTIAVREFDDIVPLNSSTAIGLIGGFSEPIYRGYFTESYTEATIIRYQNGVINYSNPIRILTGINGSGYRNLNVSVKKSNIKGIRLSDNKFIMFGNSSIERIADDYYLHRPTASIIEFSGTTLKAINSIQVTTSGLYANSLMTAGCLSNKCYVTLRDYYSEYYHYQIDISGSTMVSKNEQSPGYVCGDKENKSNVIAQKFSTSNCEIINLGTGKHIINWPSSRAEFYIDNVEMENSSVARGDVLCRLGNDKLVSVKVVNKEVNFNFVQYDTGIKKLVLKKTIIDPDIKYNSQDGNIRIAPIGDGTCILNYNSVNKLIKW